LILTSGFGRFAVFFGSFLATSFFGSFLAGSFFGVVPGSFLA